MKAERWKQIDELFDAVLEITEERRRDFLAEKCAGDEDLRLEVLSLLAAEGFSESFIESSAINLIAEEMAADHTVILSFIGKRFGIYQIEKAIGSGGMGEVFLAHDTKLDRKVAIKILPSEFLADPNRIKRFEREARIVSALNHPYIVTVHDVGTSNGVNYIATEFVDGETVRDLIGKGVEVKDALSIISQTCEALAAAHKIGIVHRDIKPENIMIRSDGYVKILDFGLAKLVELAEPMQSLSNYTIDGMRIGTPAYMSAEQISGEQLDHRTDLWSVGVVFYEMLAGKNPFKGESNHVTFQRILSFDPEPISRIDQSVPVELDAILKKALEKDRDVSYQTASDLQADLKRVRREIDSSPSLKISSLSPAPENTRPWSRGYLRYAVLLAVVAVIGLTSWYFVFRSTPEPVADWSTATNVQLTNAKGTEYFPSLSPDGKSFIYASDSDGDFNIFVQRVGGKNPTNLTNGSKADDTQPSFSPSGDHIAFRSEREPKGVYIMEASGENVRRINDFGFQPSWSPDGRELVVSTFGVAEPNVRMGSNNGLWIVNIETGAERELLHEDAAFATWSPKGKRIAYWLFPGRLARRDVATISAQGGEPVLITKDFGTSNWNPVWSPDGKFLYFVSDKGGNVNFWRVRIDEDDGKVLSPPERITTPSQYSRHINFSGNGKRMIYVQTDNESNLQGIKFDAATERTSDEVFWITRGDREIIRAELSPDGRQFVMRQTRRTQDDITIYDRSADAWLDITNDAPFDRYPRWSPDGRQIAYGSDKGGGFEVWVCDADGGNARQVTFVHTPKQGSSFPNWSPDGTQLIYTNSLEPFIVDLTRGWEEQGGPQRVLPPEIQKLFVVWDWSPDGTKLIGMLPLDERAIAVYSFETRTLERIVEDVDTVPSWLPDSRRFVFENKNKLFIADSETKRTKEVLSHKPELIRGPFVSRDGNLLYYTAHSSESNIWMLDLSQSP